MNIHFQDMIPEDFDNNSRVWVYQSNRPFTISEALEIEELLEDFCKVWNSHGSEVKSYANLFFGNFIIIMADETNIKVGGCSTDSSLRFIKKIEADYNVKLLNRQMLAFIVKENIRLIPLSKVNSSIEEDIITPDTLYFNNTILTRKELLKKLIGPLKSKQVIYNDHIEDKGTDLFAKAKKEEWEGIIGKDAHSYYISGKRSDRWVKFKLQNSQEAIICGYTAPTGSRKHFGALVLGVNDGNKTRYIGNCGTGFNETSIKELYAQMHPIETGKKPFDEKVHQRTKVTWIKPQLVCEVWYAEWTGDGHLRQPVYKGLRIDKNKEKVVMETPDTQLADEETISFGRIELKVTHLNKVFWKQEGITKGELIHYYRDMAGYIVPYLKDRPISMRRQPNGTEDEGFFQKDVDVSHLPSWIKTHPLYSESNDKNINYITGSDAATLMYMVNLGCIEINPWLSSYKKPDNPDFVVIDIDPHDVPFTEAVEVALKTKEIFERMQLDVFIKTSGSKGLHIYCYVGAKYDYDFTKMFAEYVAKLVHDELPDITSVERNPAKRKNKTYVDFLQNRRGQTIACPYSVRPKPGATVSAPLHWHEVNNDLKLSDYTIHNMRERVKQVDDPWKDLTKNKADLRKALELLKK